MSAAGLLASLTRLGQPRQLLPEAPPLPPPVPPARQSAPAVEFLYHLHQLGRTPRPVRREPLPLAAFMAHLSGLGVRLWSEGKRLRFSAPPGALTPELKGELAARKAEVLAFLEDARRLAAAPEPPQRAPREGDLPLSWGQETLWFLDQIEPGSPFYNMPVALRLTGALDVAALAGALREAVRRHEILRTRFPAVDGRPVQAIGDGSPDLPVLDLRALPPDRREALARDLATAEARRPFDLARGPLLRATLLRLGEGGQVLLLTLHHIIFDGGSIPALYRELETLYAARAAGLPSPLPEPELQYADFAVWQRGQLSGARLEELLAWWRRQLAPPLPLLQLPLDRPRPAVQRFRGGARRALVLGAAETGALQALGRREGATLFTALLAAFAVLLHRTAGQEDLLLGTDADLRDRAELDGMMGFFVNQLVLRADLSGQPGFAAVLARLRDMVHAASLHRALPFEKLVADLKPERDLSRNPLFQVSFGFRHGPARPLALPGLDVHPLAVETGRVQFDLALALTETPDGLEARLEHDADLFDGTTAARLLERLGVLLAAVAAGDGRPVADLPLLTEAESHQIFAAWNDSAAPLTEQGLLERLDALAGRSPDAVAVTGGGAPLTRSELRGRVHHLAGELAALGVGPDVVVAVLAERGPDFLVAVLAILAAGGAYLPLDPRHPAERHRQILEQSRTRLVLVGPGLKDSKDSKDFKDRVRFLSLVSLESLESLAPPAPRLETGLAYVIYTSGSTGLPKGAMVERSGMLNHLEAKLSDLEITAADVVAQTASQCFDISVWQLLAPLASGGRLHFVDDDTVRDPRRLLAEVEAAGITLLEIVPSLLRALLEPLEAAPASRPALSSLRWLILTGEALPPDLCRRWLRLYPAIPLLNAYGPTECSDDVTHHRLPGPPAADAVHVPIGRPVRNARLHLLDRGLRPVPPGSLGALFVGGPVVGRGYLHDPARTAAAFLPDPFAAEPGARLYATGDLARQLPDGLLQFLGRADHQVKIRGFRIELGEIEAALRRHPAVREAVAATRDEDGAAGRRLAAFVVPAGPPPSPAALRAWLVEILPEHSVPSAFVILDALPLNGNGKIDRQALPWSDAGASAPHASAAPRDAVEETLAGIWSRVLGVERVGIHDSFFDLGGDSILSIQIAARAGQAGLPLSPRDLFQHKTVAELAAVVGARRPVAAEQGAVTGPAPLTPIQRWFFELDLPAPHHWNQALLLEVRPELDARRLEGALRALLAHHDALRLRFKREGDWQQTGMPPGSAVPLLQISLGALPAGLRAAARESAAAAAQVSLDLAHGPLLRGVWFVPEPGEDGRLLLVIHHLAVDGVSWRILLEDLVTAAEQLGRGEPVRLPAKTTPFRAWAEALAAEARAAVDRDWWLSRDWRVAPLPLDAPQAEDREADAESVSIVLDAGATRALLREVPEAYGTRINDVLLTALAQAAARWTGAPSLLVDLESHGRDEEIGGVDLSRTVGWFTSLSPVLLELPAGGGPGEALKAVKEQLRAVPRQGIGYGLLRWMSGAPEAEAALRALPRAEVVFNYLGQLDPVFSGRSPFALADADSGPPRSPRGRRAHRLEVNGWVLDGRLQVRWIYGGRVLRRATVEALAQGFERALQELIAHCSAPGTGGYTPSDFSLMDFDQAELDGLLAELATEDDA